jgi:hypothetical protein
LRYGRKQKQQQWHDEKKEAKFQIKNGNKQKEGGIF